MRLVGLCLVAALSASPALAQDEENEGEEDSDDGGWGDEGDEAGFGEAAPVAELAPLEKPRLFSFGGTLQTEEAFWLESKEGRSHFAKARQSFDPWLDFRYEQVRARVSGHGEFDFAILANQDQWDDATVDMYQYQVLLREAWLNLTTGPVDTTLGRQVVGWGEGRTVSTLDVVNPRDLREPGMADLEDLRLPVTMARVSLGLQSEKFWKGSHRFELIVMPEADWGYRSPPNGPFGNLPGILDSTDFELELNGIDFREELTTAELSYNHLQPRWSTDQVQGFARWSWRGRGLDIAAMGATVYDQQGVFVMPELLVLAEAATQDQPIAIDIDHQRYTLLGTSGSGQLPWLLVRWEAAYKRGLAVNTGDVIVMGQSAFEPPSFDVNTEDVDLVQALIGLSWSGWKGTTIDIDVSDGFIVAGPTETIFPVDAAAWGLRATKPLLKQRMEVDATIVGWGWTAEHGWLGRAGVSYDLLDGLAASVAAITYQPGEERGPIIGLDKHDRVQVGMRWDF